MGQVIEVKQGTPEWFEARSGMATASCFDKVMAGTTLKKSATQKKYAAEIISNERSFTGSSWTERGTELEPDARLVYEIRHGVDVQEVGFVKGYGCGASPDGLVLSLIHISEPTRPY